MKSMNTLIGERLNKATPTKKMALMAERSASGQMNSFTGLFGVSELSAHEKAHLETLLAEYSTGEEDIDRDLSALSHITSEVKAINNQAALLHGERIKKAQTLLQKYKDGAFSAWLIATYGNRQTPYNLMQYYEFYTALPHALQPKLETMPRQAIYTLASREGEIGQKTEIVENYAGETKSALLALIRSLFPLKENDRRKENLFLNALSGLEKVRFTLGKIDSLTARQKEELKEALNLVKSYIDPIKTR
jgi:hypothetical protein